MRRLIEKGEAPVIGPTEASVKTTSAIKQKELSMSDSTTTSAICALTPDLEVIEGQIITTSQQIAEHFGKRHADVIRAIRKLEAPAEFTERNFALSEFTDRTGRTLPAYRITRDGFTLLAMGFTGKEAMQWKVAYLNAFNKMEAELMGRVSRPTNPALDYTRISPNQAQDLKELVHAIVDAKVQGFGETWARLHKKFRINSYLELPATRFEEARDYLLGKLPQRSGGTLNETIDRLTLQVTSGNGAPVELFMPLVTAVLQRLGLGFMPAEPTAQQKMVIGSTKRCRDDLTFTRRANGILINWSIEPRSPYWNAGVKRGMDFFKEIEELAAHNEQEAISAVRCAFVGGWPDLSTDMSQWSGRGLGEECGFADEVASAAIDGLRARRLAAPRPASLRLQR